MLDQHHIDDLLRVDRLELPAAPRVLEVRHEPYVDSEGKDALLIWVILDNRTKDSQRRWASLEPIESALRIALRKGEVSLWPYFKYRTRAEFNQEKRLVSRGAAR